ncbi:tigger transposable element-derived protein 2-like isoform X2 [Penaeus chinensis]|nr:tigger transposable element-derived protein 2-like isoform X2 [Penaeus chinensis]
MVEKMMIAMFSRSATWTTCRKKSQCLCQHNREEIHSLGTKAEPMFMTWEEDGPQNSSGDAFIMQLQKVIQDGNHTPDQVFTATKTGLFWKRLPAQTFISKKEKKSTSCKAWSDLFTFLMCANVSRDFRLSVC